MNPTTTDREGRIKQKLDEKLQILNSPMNHIHTEHLLDVVNEIVVAELKEERQRTLKGAREAVRKLSEEKENIRRGFRDELDDNVEQPDTQENMWEKEYELKGINAALAALSELEGEITGNEKDNGTQ